MGGSGIKNTKSLLNPQMLSVYNNIVTVLISDDEITLLFPTLPRAERVDTRQEDTMWASFTSCLLAPFLPVMCLCAFIFSRLFRNS
ncbi:hypothetical protein V1478_009431, partial [Vespula squamosa]